MSHRHEQKHLLHNWSDCRYRDYPQSPRAVLRVRLTGCNRHKQRIFVADAHRQDRKRFVVRAHNNLREFVELERLADEPFRFVQVGRPATANCLRSFDELLTFATAKVFLF